MIKQAAIEKFLDDLASQNATPGGGSAAAIIGAMGAALVAMVCNLTIGKKKYADVEDEMRALLAKAEERLPLLVDQGEQDSFLAEQLKPQALQRAAEAVGHPLELRLQPGYDHSYFFVASFIDDHLRHHAAALTAP